MTEKDSSRAPAAAPCPICGKPATAPYRPFCSSRCRTIDLGRWLSDAYAVDSVDPPGTTGEDEEPN